VHLDVIWYPLFVIHTQGVGHSGTEGKMGLVTMVEVSVGNGMAARDHPENALKKIAFASGQTCLRTVGPRPETRPGVGFWEDHRDGIRDGLLRVAGRT